MCRVRNLGLNEKATILDELVAGAESDLEEICDRCRYTVELIQEELDEKCESCPVVKIGMLLGL